MLNKAAKIPRDSPTNIKLVGSGQIPGPVTSGEFYQLSLTTGRARSENQVEGGVYTYPAAAVCSSPRRTILLEGGGDSMLCPATDLERNCQVAFEKIEQKSLNILHAVSSEYAIKRKHDHMTRQNWPQEENFSSKRSRTNKLEGETRRGGIDERENGDAADQSDSTFKVSSGDSDLTAERMADGSSRTTSSSDNNNNTNNNNSGYGYGCTHKMDPPRPSPSTTPGILPSFTEKFQGACIDSGLHQNIRSNIDNGQTVYRSDGYSSLFKPDSERDGDWLALGLGSSYGSLQPKPLSNQPDLDMTNGIKGSIISWNKDKDKYRDDQRRQQPQQVFTAGHKSSSRLTTLLPPSTSIQAASPQPFSFHNIRADMSNFSNSRPLEQGASPNKFSFQRSITDSSTLPGLNLLQPCTMENQERSQTIAVCPSLFPSVEHSFKFQRQTGETSSRLKDAAASWQGLYDRISEAGIPGNASTSNSTDLCFSEPRIGSFYQGSQRLSQGWKSLIPGSADAYQNLETDGPAYAGMADAAALQQVILEKMQCRTQWNTRDNFSSWYKPEISLGSLIRPSAAEVSTNKFSSAERTLPFRQQQQYERQATPSDRNMPAPVREMPRFPGASWAENVRIFRPSRTAQAGVWFVLQALNDQNGDRMLPQISRNYLRIKDGTTTILLVKKYLVNKLGLNSESEIEIMCKGQQLLPSMTLKQVRDVMWSSTFKEEEISRSVASNCSSTDHLMVLHYQRNNNLLHQYQHHLPPPPVSASASSAQF